MPGPGSSVRPRPGGGFNSGMSGMSSFGEHMDENAMQQAMGQKQQGQQGSQLNPTMGAAQQQLAQQQTQNQQPPRELGTLTEELITRPAKDIVKGLGSLFDIYNWLGIKKYEPDPEKIAKHKQMLHRYNQLDAEDQAQVRKTTQKRMQEQKMRQEEEERKKQQAAAAQQDFVMPSSPKKGPEGPGGSGKKRATQKLQQDRKTLSGPSSAN